MHRSNSGSKTEFGYAQNERPPPPDCHTARPSQLAKTKTDLGRVSTLLTQCSRLLQASVWIKRFYRFLPKFRDFSRDLKCEVSADSTSDRLFIEISLETVSIIWNWIFQFCQKCKHLGISGTNSIVKRVILKIGFWNFL